MRGEAIQDESESSSEEEEKDEEKNEKKIQNGEQLPIQVPADPFAPPTAPGTSAGMSAVFTKDGNGGGGLEESVVNTDKLAVMPLTSRESVPAPPDLPHRGLPCPVTI